jgi:hypothetical protein
VVSVGLFVPAATLSTVHAYIGVAPPFVGVAVNVIEFPVHCGETGDAATVTVGVTVGVTVIDVVDVAVVGDAHGLLDVMVSLTLLAAPDGNVEFVYVLAVDTCVHVPPLLVEISHEYVGVVPPFTGAAVNSTDEP